MKTNLFILLIYFALPKCHSQNKVTLKEQKANGEIARFNKTIIHVELHSRVDTTKSEIKEIIALWTNYLNSEPDKITGNPYWNEEEKSKYIKCDFSVPYLYQFPSSQLLLYYKPTILSIEKEGDYYGIRTIFAADGAEGEYRKSNPWSITKLYAVKENGKWKLKNALSVITENWNKKTIGKITFIYPSTHVFNQELAKQANDFCEQISKEFHLPDFQPFNFYITHSADEMGHLLNFDFYYAGYTTGVGMNENRILFSAKNSEYFPHEFVHMVIPKFERHWLIEEGFATWKGGTEEMTFEEVTKRFANELAKNDTVTFADVLNKKWGWKVAAFYSTGAILCNAAYRKGGVKMVKELLETPNNNDKLIDNMCLVFNINRKDIDSFWRTETLKYRTN